MISLSLSLGADTVLKKIKGLKRKAVSEGKGAAAEPNGEGSVAKLGGKKGKRMKLIKARRVLVLAAWVAKT